MWLRALQHDQPGAGDRRREVAAVREVVHPVVARVQHERRQVQRAAAGRPRWPACAAGGRRARSAARSTPAAARRASVICSSVAPGIIIEVNTRRNAESGRAQPTLINASNAASSSRSSGVGSRNAAGVAAVEDQPGHPLRVARRVRDRRRAALRHRHQREPVESRRRRRPPRGPRSAPRARSPRRPSRTGRGHARRSGRRWRPRRGRRGSAATPGSASRAGGGSASRSRSPAAGPTRAGPRRSGCRRRTGRTAAPAAAGRSRDSSLARSKSYLRGHPRQRFVADRNPAGTQRHRGQGRVGIVSHRIR